MIKQFLSVILLFIGFTVFSQEQGFKTPDYKAIEKAIKDKNSPFYYPALMERLTKNDTLLSNDEYRHLYLGYVFQPKYNAFWSSPDNKKLREYYAKEKLENRL